MVGLVVMVRRCFIKARIRNILGVNTTILARKTRFAKIDWVTAGEFFNTYHLHGSGPTASINHGLYLGEKLVMAASYKRKKDSYELHRMATNGCTVIGGFSKLLNHRPGPVWSYVDVDWTPDPINNGYTKVGFDFVRYTGPSLEFTDLKSVYNRQSFQKHKIGKSVSDLGVEGIYPLYRCGNYLMKLN